MLYLQGILIGRNQDKLDAVAVNSCILFSTLFKSRTSNMNTSNVMFKFPTWNTHEKVDCYALW